MCSYYKVLRISRAVILGFLSITPLVHCITNEKNLDLQLIFVVDWLTQRLYQMNSKNSRFSPNFNTNVLCFPFFCFANNYANNTRSSFTYNFGEEDFVSTYFISEISMHLSTQEPTFSVTTAMAIRRFFNLLSYVSNVLLFA